MRAGVDRETCTGCGSCAETCPEVFRMEEGRSKVHADPVPESAEESCEKAADNCPVDAIKVE
ncbi:MAG: ferredoxin [Candidatus Omnitrophica bacterium]|nr:ferredoxin [Candidatus Omnitrophota bacterium]